MSRGGGIGVSSEVHQCVCNRNKNQAHQAGLKNANMRIYISLIHTCISPQHPYNYSNMHLQKLPYTLRYKVGKVIEVHLTEKEIRYNTRIHTSPKEYADDASPSTFDSIAYGSFTWF
jgi:hypothetical protein